MTSINPRLLNLNRSRYRDIDLSFKRNPLNNDLQTLSTTESIKQSVRNLVLTAFYEKWFRPDIGNFAASSIFELFIDEHVDAIQNSIYNMLLRYEPRITFKNNKRDIEVTEDVADGNELRVKINYLIVGSNDQDNIQIRVQRLK